MNNINQNKGKEWLNKMDEPRIRCLAGTHPVEGRSSSVYAMDMSSQNQRFYMQVSTLIPPLDNHCHLII